MSTSGTRAFGRAKPAAGGFTLVELMITVLIISVLAGLATRSYMKTLRISNRTDAIATMTTYSQQLERCYSQYFSYQTYTGSTGSCLTAPPASGNSPKGYYSITVAVASSGTPLTDPSGQVDQYLITATANSGTIQYNDTSCRTLYLTNLGAQLSADASGTLSSTGCWATN